MSLELKNASFHFGQEIIVHSASMAVVPGKITALVGPNGAGKSSILKLLSGESEPSGGRVTMDGQALQKMSLAEQACRRSVVGQFSHIVFAFSVREILSLGWEPFRDQAPMAETLVQEVAQAMDITHLLTRQYNELSGGERQRVQIGRALIQLSGADLDEHSNKYLLLDEPTSSLDVAHELDILRRLRREARRGVGVMIILHDLNLAARFCDQVVLLEQGRILAADQPRNCMTSDNLTALYNTEIRVEWHAGLERLVIHS